MNFNEFTFPVSYDGYYIFHPDYPEIKLSANHKLIDKTTVEVSNIPALKKLLEEKGII